MTDFQIKLAGIPMRIHAFYPETELFCRDYLTQEEPVFEITLNRSDLDHIRKISEKTDLAEGREPAGYSDTFLESLALYYRIAEELLSCGVLLFHASVLAVDGNAYMFTARSGVGKTTHTELWLKNIPGCHVLNGDKPLILFSENGVFACGTPWQGKENYGTNEILPLKAVCFLERGEKNEIVPVSFHDVFSTLLTQSHHPHGNAALPASVKLLEQMRSVPMYRLKCRMDDDAAWVSYLGMAKS